MAAASSSSSGGAEEVNSPGRYPRTHRSGGSSASRKARSTRSRTTSGGSDPAHPA
jgi:hypothetical protein